MNILYCSTLCSKRTINVIEEKYNTLLSGITTQKYHRLIITGLCKNGNTIDAISSIPITKTKETVIKLDNDVEDSIIYHYPITINIPIIRHLCIFLGTIYNIVIWAIKNRNKSKVIICDILNISTTLGAIVSRILGNRVVGIVTDMPGLMITTTKNRYSNIIKNVNLYILNKLDAYVFLTEAMNDVINKKHRPYIIMEGLVDNEMQYHHRDTTNVDTKNIIYAGGLYEQYGVKNLIEAFIKLEGDDYRLLLFGTGPMSNTICEYEQMDSRIKYLGLRPNSEIVKEELKAYLLVNPRPTHEEFTKYSFPSKNMEYMASGTPLLTTNLPGMPEEYHKYVFICNNENSEGIYNEFIKISQIPEKDLKRIGENAKCFVLNHKNNIMQASRIIELVNII